MSKTITLTITGGDPSLRAWGNLWRSPVRPGDAPARAGLIFGVGLPWTDVLDDGDLVVRVDFPGAARAFVIEVREGGPGGRLLVGKRFAASSHGSRVVHFTV